MSGYLVDTNLPSELTKPTPDPRVTAFLIAAGRESVYASVITIGESRKGLPLCARASAGPSCRTGWIG